MSEEKQQRRTLKQRLWEIIFEAETPAGKWFDIVLLWLIFFSVLAVMLETVEPLYARWGRVLKVLEWCFTIIFTIEYLLRLFVTRRPLRYSVSFFGIVDLLSILPTYLALMFIEASGFAVIRLLRLLRMFRILKMVHHIRGARVIAEGLRQSKPKITVFFFAVLIISVIAGTLIYYVESSVEGTKFTSIPVSIYYAIVSISTVGYGDITVTTPFGQFLTTLLILTGYAIIAVPTGIVTSELMRVDRKVDETTDACPGCGVHGHLEDAVYCRRCGERLGSNQKGVKKDKELKKTH